MEETNSRPHDINYYTFEAVMAREEQHVKRLTIALIISIIGIVVSNLVWLYAWTRYDYVDSGVETTVALDGSPGGNANYIGQRGIINNGESDGQNPYMETYQDTENW